MTNYQQILVALDIYSEYDPILSRALMLAEQPSNIHLVFVILPSSYFQPYISGVGSQFVIDIETQAKERLAEIGRKFNIPKSHIHVLVGDVSDEIRSLASKVEADLIVIGTHGRQGLKLLLGSTANAVLHGVHRDVLAVRVKEE
ncbi:universal stress protein [Aliiglaciecola sp. LCG003]|uniref:universal stress protein n=1 Tax=Aliiglaciecola sp. LCG003 TaxID=3053655 RepID=UPI0025731078|nr:universal stress protein [Aliiglaciecola sp. LCG003]WJG07685.1 universal stress protein [Aliiglaciecola sp. LCG003]